MNEEAIGDDREVTRSEAAEYLHDMTGQLAEMARRFGLLSAADALTKARQAVESEF